MKKIDRLIACMLIIAIVFIISACSNENTYPEREYQDLLDENRSLRNEIRELKNELDELNSQLSAQGKSSELDELIGTWKAIYVESRDEGGNTQIFNFADVDAEQSLHMLFFRDSVWEFHEDGSLSTYLFGDANTYFEDEFQDADPEQVEAFLNATNGVWVSDGNSSTGGMLYTLTMNSVIVQSDEGMFNSAVIITVENGEMWLTYEEEDVTLFFERITQ